MGDDGKKIQGIPADSCWLFLAEPGRINKYGATSDLNPLITHIQKGGNGKILPLTQENVLALVRSNEKAVSLAKKGKLLKAISCFNEEEW